MDSISIFYAYPRETIMSADEFSKRRREYFERYLRSIDYVEEGNGERNEEIYRDVLDQRLSRHKRGIESTKLQIQLMNVLKELRPRYHVPYQTTMQKAKTLDETERETSDMNSCQTTSYTYKFFYILTAAIYGIFVGWLHYQPPILLSNFIIFFLMGLIPTKNIISLPMPSKFICEKCKLIESFLWKKVISHEHINEMKKLRNQGYLLIFLSVLWQILNLVFICTIFVVITSTDLIPHQSYPDGSFQNLLSYYEFYLFAVMYPIFLAVGLKNWCFRWMIKNNYSPTIIRLFF